MSAHPPEVDQFADTVVSADGTAIGYLTTGDGPSVIVIPGALATASGYTRFAQTLGERFTVHTIERRGRGVSGPQGDGYGIETEIADLRALQDKTGAAHLVGHSYGGLIALEAARDDDRIEKIAVYEPGVSMDGSVPADWIPAYEKYLTRNQPWDAFIEFVRAVGPDGIRRIPRWMMKRAMPLAMKAPERETVIGLLPENLREHREVIRLDNTYPNYGEIRAQVLLLDGDKDRRARDDADRTRLAATIPHCTRHTFPGLDHFGMDKNGPARVAAAVAEFLSAA